MGVSLKKIEDEAPHLVSLVKSTISLVKDDLGFDPEQNQAAVVAVIDDSGSTQHLYRSGEIQDVADKAFAAGLVFDDDGEVPAALFSSNVQDLGNITLQNCQGFIGRQSPRWGGTIYTAALEWIIDQANYSNVDLSVPHVEQKSGGFFGKTKQVPGALSAKATAPYPMFAIFITDGEPQDDPNEIRQLITAMSQLPIFIQFIGVGSHDFQFLRSLDDLEGRFIDNAGFFDAKDAGGDENKMLAGLLNEFPDYYKKARDAGLIG